MGMSECLLFIALCLHGVWYISLAFLATYIFVKGEKFGNWKAKFSVQAQQSDISNLLVTCPHIRSLHSQLVPAKVSYETFWMRYFYKVQLLEQVRVHQYENKGVSLWL